MLDKYQGVFEKLKSDIKSNQLDAFFQDFLVVAASELQKIKRSSEFSTAPMNGEQQGQFATLARITRDIASELRQYHREKTELDDEQLLKMIIGMLKQKPNLKNMLGVDDERLNQD